MNESTEIMSNQSTAYGEQFIDICRKIRQLAMLERVKVDIERNIAEDSIMHLIKLIEECGITIKQFICGYLSTLQPYAFEAFQGGKQKDKNDTWIADIGYRVKLVIKIKSVNEGREMLVISFHESNISTTGRVYQCH